MRKKPRLTLVSSKNRPSGHVFDDLDKLREEGSAPTRRQRLSDPETFARIPHDRALKLYPHLSGSAWVALVELDRIILKHRGQNPVRFVSSRLRALGLCQQARARIVTRGNNWLVLADFNFLTVSSSCRLGLNCLRTQPSPYGANRGI